MAERMICWKDCSTPFPRAGLWYVSRRGVLFEAWAQTQEADESGPTPDNRSDFSWHTIGRIRDDEETNA